jgi:hypothetical protein
MAVSKPTWCDELKCPEQNRNKPINKKVVPIIICKPWKPVAKKKHEPNIPSAKEKDENLYSNACKVVKNKAKKRVIIKGIITLVLVCLPIRLWWHQVKEAPEVNKIKVLANGTSQGFNASIPLGGHIEPNSTLGANEEWKKAQNIEKKKNTSDITNNIKPIFIPFCTRLVW